MNYKNIYDTIILRAQQRTILPGFYFEKHHIIPKCLGGDNSKSNLVKLFPEEHFLCHQLLTKLYPTEKKLKFALVKMTGKLPFRNNKCYGWIRKQFGSARKGAKATPATLEKLSKAATGRIPSEETRAKMSLSQQKRQAERLLNPPPPRPPKPPKDPKTRKEERKLWWKAYDAAHPKRAKMVSPAGIEPTSES